jgi:hypothetical protein
LCCCCSSGFLKIPCPTTENTDRGEFAEVLMRQIRKEVNFKRFTFGCGNYNIWLVLNRTPSNSLTSPLLHNTTTTIK